MGQSPNLLKWSFAVALIFCVSGFFYFHPFLKGSSSSRTVLFEEAARVPLQQSQLERTHSRVEQLEAATGLLQRLLPERASEFRLEMFPNSGFAPSDSPLSRGPDVFELESDDGIVVIRGNSGVAIAVGLNWYLKYYCGCHISWEKTGGNQLDLPLVLPIISKRERHESVVPFLYYENVCTFSYSQSWWDWERWEQEIDWMALNGINLPLALTGQEFVVQRVFQKFGVSAEEMQNFFTGPAFLAWNRMGNIKKFASPLPPDFIRMQYRLQRKILQRSRSLGMTPVLPSFAGFVPDALVSKFPDVQFRYGQPWSGFKGDECCVAMLEPGSELFLKIGKEFTKEIIATYGTDHLYSCDTFNENRPNTDDTSYLTRSSNAVFSAMTSVDPKAVWVMQGWLFLNDHSYWTEIKTKALLDGVPSSRLLLLDLHADVFPLWPKTDGIYDRLFVWSALHNFGGQNGNYGRLIDYTESFTKSRDYSNLLGIGLTMEGIEQNAIVYNFISEMRFHPNIINVSDWVSTYVISRYGISAAENNLKKEVVSIWIPIALSVYNVQARQMGASKSLIEVRPHMEMTVKSVFQPTVPGYDTSILFKSWRRLVTSVGPALRKQKTFLHDLVDFTRQVLADYFYLLYSELLHSYFDKNTHKMEETISKMNLVMVEMDKLLQTQSQFMLGRYISDARSVAGDDDQIKWHFEWNARNQVTRWGSNGEINDYASKLWSGLVGTYYKERWHIFFTHLRASIDKSEINYNNYFGDLEAFERNWVINRDLILPSEPFGDTLAIVGNIHSQFAEHAQSLYDARNIK